MNIPSLANWQTNRGLGLRHLEKIVPDLMSVNARETRTLSEALDTKIPTLPGMKNITQHDEIDAIVVVKGSDIVFEHYGQDFSASDVHSAQSSTKPVSLLLLDQAIRAGKIAIDDKVEQYIPEIGSGFYGRTIEDIMSMNVAHEFNEMTAYTALEGSRLYQLRLEDEMSFGYLPLEGRPFVARREFAQKLRPSANTNSNENVDNNRIYSTINTEVAGWIIERAMNMPLSYMVRTLMHDIGGENTVHMSVDHTGVPSIGAGLILTARDFARYGMLLRDCPYIDKVNSKPGTLVPDSSQTYRVSLTSLAFGYSHSGWGGQYIFVDPKKDLVVAIFGGIRGEDPMPSAYFQTVESAIHEVHSYYRP